MADRLPELVVLDRFEALAAWVHTQRRDGAVLVPLASVVELMAGVEPTPGGLVGRCGQGMPFVGIGKRLAETVTCSLPSGHVGWHRDGRAEWGRVQCEEVEPATSSRVLVERAHLAWLRRIADGTGELLMTDAFDEHSPAVAHLRQVVDEVT